MRTHYCTRYGEIDILARDGDTIVAVEVKARRSETFGAAVESITRKKYERLVLTLQCFLLETHQEHAPHRVDLIAIDGLTLRHLVAIDSSYPYLLPRRHF